MWWLIECSFPIPFPLSGVHVISLSYYTGEKKAPLLTLVIGGNHEASNYMWELCVVASLPCDQSCLMPLSHTVRYHGGWLAPNIYFLGHAGCVQVNGVRIAGASGIYKSHDFPLGALRPLLPLFCGLT